MLSSSLIQGFKLRCKTSGCGQTTLFLPCVPASGTLVAHSRAKVRELMRRSLRQEWLQSRAHSPPHNLKSDCQQNERGETRHYAGASQAKSFHETICVTVAEPNENAN